MNPRGIAYGYLWVDCDKKDVASVEQSLNTLISNTSHIKMDTYLLIMRGYNLPNLQAA